MDHASWGFPEGTGNRVPFFANLFRVYRVSGRLVRAAATSVSVHCHGMLWLQVDSIIYLSGLNLLSYDLQGVVGWVGGSVL